MTGRLISIFLGMIVFSTGCGIEEKQLSQTSQDSAPPVSVISPGSEVEIVFSLACGGPVYSVRYKGKTIIKESALQIEFKETGGFSNLKVSDVKRRSFDETYALVVGKSNKARNHYNEMTVSLESEDSLKRGVDVVFRAFDDGAAFRYVFGKEQTGRDFEILAETTEFNFAGDYYCWALGLEKFTTNYERKIDKIKLSEIGVDALVGLPLVVEIDKTITAALTEANLTDYAGMYLTGAKGTGSGLVCRLSPRPDDDGVCVKGRLPHRTPWRVIMLAESPGALIESDIVLNLNEPCAIGDTSWIKPGRVAWPWWSGRVVTDVDFEGGMNTGTMKYYIDFAAENDFEYLLIDAKWYGDHHDGSLDITKTIPEIDMAGIISYAKERNVDIIVWLNWENTDRQMEEAFALYRQWGVKGVKIDYMNRDDQEVVNFYHRATKEAAKHHLLVDFHGAYKPAGIRRTWPNLMTREGVMGLEHVKWSRRITPGHNVTIPFTRMAAGPMDYTPGGFDNVTDEAFEARRKAPMVTGTRCHHLAMFVVYESPLQMVSDHPGAYRGQVGIEFLRVVPASWDRTKVLAGRIGEYIAIARRRGKEWFIGAMTNDKARTLALGLDFLGDGEYEASIYSDGPDSANKPKNVTISRQRVKSKDKLTAQMASGGGYAVYLRPVE